MLPGNTPHQCFIRARRLAFSAAATCGFILAGPVHAQEGEAQFIELLNEFRQNTEECAGEPVSAAGPLASSPQLGEVSIGSGQRLLTVLQEAGYRASRARSMAISGPRDAETAMQALGRQYCTELLSNRYSEVGVSRSGAVWQVVLATPLLANDLGEWEEAGREVLERVNEMRSRTRTCGTEVHPAAPPLKWNQTLGVSALAHSRDMADQGYFSHFSPAGSNVGDRARRDGYDWRSIGENIAAGQDSPSRVVAGWMQSPGHCTAIMNPDFAEMGAAYAVNEASPSGIYWTQVFGRPR